MSISASTTPSLFSMELRTTRWAQMLRWYSISLGLPVLLRSEEGQYALLAAGETKLTLLGRDKVDLPSGRWSLAFEVSNLPRVLQELIKAESRPSQPRVDPEGYAEFTVKDPDGNRVRVFQWVDE
ncbi:MAG: VOC family protein [Pirellulales bacterium]